MGSTFPAQHKDLFMNIYDVFETDYKKETEGAWTKLTGDAEVKLCYFTNDKFLRYNQEEAEKWLSANGKEILPDDVSEEIHVRSMSKFVLVDWKNIKGKDNVEIPYSEEAAFELLSNPDMRRFKAAIIRLSQTMSTFKHKREEEDTKNSETSSNGA